MQISIEVETKYFISCDEIYKKYGFQNGHVIVQRLLNKLNSLNNNRIRYINRKYINRKGKEAIKQSSGFLCDDKKAVQELLAL